MRIVDIRESTVPIASSIRNAYIDFSKMTASIVAIVTDVVRDGRPVVGFGFNSNGRYDQSCLLRTRFIPRLMSAEPASLLSADETNLDAGGVLRCAGGRENANRSIAGVFDRQTGNHDVAWRWLWLWTRRASADQRGENGNK